MKAKLGMRKVRPWKWMPFTNPARRDGLVLYHWRRAAEKGQDYAFAKFNKKLEVLRYNYLIQQYMDVCQSFDTCRKFHTAERMQC